MTRYHPKADQEWIEERAMHDIQEDYDPYIRDHRGRVIGAKGPGGGWIEVDSPIEVACEDCSAKFERDLGISMGMIRRFRSTKQIPQSELHFFNDAELTFGYRRLVGPTDYVGRIGSAEYRAIRSLRSAVTDAIGEYKYDPEQIYSVTATSITVAGGDLDGWEIREIEDTFDVQIDVEDANHGTRYVIEGEKDSARLEQFYHNAQMVEKKYPSVRRHHEYECSCGWSGIGLELDLLNENGPEAARVCPECGTVQQECGEQQN